MNAAVATSQSIGRSEGRDDSSVSRVWAEDGIAATCF
jgi:hypothetical protein